MVTNSSSFGHIITNMISLFMKPCTVELGVSDYRKLIMSICRMNFAKGESKKFFYRCYRNFDSKLFEETLIKNFLRRSFLLKVSKPLLAELSKNLHL